MRFYPLGQRGGTTRGSGIGAGWQQSVETATGAAFSCICLAANETYDSGAPQRMSPLLSSNGHRVAHQVPAVSYRYGNRHVNSPRQYKRALDHSAKTNGASPAGRALVVEPDELTLWSLVTFLRPWFVVETARTSAAAVRRLRNHAAEIVIISDQIERKGADVLVAAARGASPTVRLVLLTTDAQDVRLADMPVARLEKPFALPDLARLLGIPAGDILH